MNWFVFAFASAVLFTFSGLCQKLILREEETDPIALAIFFQLLVALLLLPFLFKFGLFWPSGDSVYWRVAAMGAIYTLGAFFWFKAVKVIPISEAAIISATRPFWILLGSSLFLAELVSQEKILGIALITVGIMVVYWRQGALRSFGRGQTLALLASILFAVGFLNDFTIVSRFSLPVYLFIGYLFPGVGLMLIQPKAIPKIKLLLKKKRIFQSFLLAIVSVLGIGSIYSAYLVGGEASRIMPVNQSSVVLTVILAAFFLKEREKLGRKLIGSILVVLGVMILR